MSDIVARLRDVAKVRTGQTADMMGEAADIIESMRTERDNWKQALVSEREKFQLETLRTSKLTVLLRKFADVYAADGHQSEPWSKACQRCDLLHEAMELFSEPVNSETARAAIAKATEGI